jgi:hypothetical protein
MPAILSDPPFALYALFVVAVVACGAVWVNKRDKRSGAAFLVSVGLLAGLFLLDRLFESPREEATRRVQEMARAADARNPDAFLSHVADTFEYDGTGAPRKVSREELRRSGVWSVLQQYQVHVAVWDFDRNDIREVDPNTVEIGFLAKAESGDKQIPMYLRAKFTRQPDGQLKLSGLSSYDAMKRTNERQAIPNFP